MHMDMHMGVWMALWGLLAVALLVLAVVATIWLVRDLTSRPPRSSRSADDTR